MPTAEPTQTPAPTLATPAPATPQPLPQAGGSYTRLPDGSLVPNTPPQE